MWSSYYFSHLLGQGSYGKVFLANKIQPNKISPTGNGGSGLNNRGRRVSNSESTGADLPVAIKILDKKRLAQQGGGQIEALVNEIRVHWAIFECDGVLQLLEIYEDFEFVYLVLEYQK